MEKRGRSLLTVRFFERFWLLNLFSTLFRLTQEYHCGTTYIFIYYVKPFRNFVMFYSFLLFAYPPTWLVKNSIFAFRLSFLTCKFPSYAVIILFTIYRIKIAARKFITPFTDATLNKRIYFLSFQFDKNNKTHSDFLSIAPFLWKQTQSCELHCTKSRLDKPFVLHVQVTKGWMPDHRVS